MKSNIVLFAGTYTENIRFGTGQILEGKGEGIHIFSFDPDTGMLEPVRTATGIANPSYLCLNNDNSVVYAVNELKEYQGQASGSVSAFRLDPETWELRLINCLPTCGTDPCHVTLNPLESHVFVANFMSGSVCVFPIRPDGGLAEPSNFLQHHGSSVDPHRQAGPHAHSLTFDADGRFAYVPDLGLDKVMVYEFDPLAGKLKPSRQPYRTVPPGSGPRHFTFHPNRRTAYLINELTSSISVFAYEPETGALHELHTVSTIPPGFTGLNTCADLHLTPDGRFAYGSNRGHDSLAVYRIDADGRLHCIDTIASGGKTPRNFTLDPSGRFLLAANQDSDVVSIFAVDPDTGGLAHRHDTFVPTPVCLKFANLVPSSLAP